MEFLPDNPDFPASEYQFLVGKRIVAVTQCPNADEGLSIEFEDGQVLSISFSGCEGLIEVK